MQSAPAYRYDHFRARQALEQMRHRGPMPGDRFPEIDLPAAGGGRVRSRDLLREKPLLVTTASIT